MKKYFDKVYKEGMERFQKELYDRLIYDKKTFIITANPETLMTGKENREFDSILCSKNSIITPDGIGVVKGANQVGYHVKERVTGVDIVKYLFSILDKEGRSLYLFGAKPDIVNTLANKVSDKYPGIQIVGTVDGYVDDKDAVFDDMAIKKPDVVLVALGIPMQEIMINRHYHKFDKGIFIGVGGAFDVLSGMKKRAPHFFVNHNLEWLYRICSEPKRLKRFYRSNIKYLDEIRKMKRNMR